MTRRPPGKADTGINSKASVIRACRWGGKSVSIFYFHTRDAFGVVEDADGVEFPDMTTLLMEVIRSSYELSREGAVHHGMRFEIADASGRTVLVASVQESPANWGLMARLSDALAPVH
jgi:translation elongation factor EF-Tu-like GTPase